MFDYGTDDLVHCQRDADSVFRRVDVKSSLSNEQFDLLMELSSIHSPKVILAMRDHLVKGDLRKVVCERYNVNAGYLSVCIGRLLRIEKVVSRLVRFYYQ
ncbi:PapB/FocB family fimbrial expression transcriptional regulator [Escherichia coli]|uniref:PapB/FocB family fimbrial expression transcriptional regulator n=1 Tax=Escherichia coli TaxID=562 RepID=UPI000E1D845E|nr:PapB/FocB family fimbrial expression transcriptional regulator [Escherichia coli]RDO55827.1 Major pilu subunit operon regulatory protein PapB [Escherichia coli]RDQ10605.1 Major pilu subunit operon regulatory protein PapB [Escherichia coli]